MKIADGATTENSIDTFGYKTHFPKYSTLTTSLIERITEIRRNIGYRFSSVIILRNRLLHSYGSKPQHRSITRRVLTIKMCGL